MVSPIATGGASSPINATNTFDGTGISTGVNTIVNSSQNIYNVTRNFFNFGESASGANALGMQGDIMFPLDLVDPSSNRNFYMAIEFEQYVRRSIFDPPNLKPVGGIRLPIPNELKDDQSVEWGQENLGTAAGAAMEAAAQSLNGQRLNSSNFASAAGAALKGGAGGTAVGGGIAGINALTPGAPAGAALSLAGVAQNPFITMLFKSPKFKRHTFSWRFAPTNSAESIVLRQLINTFRANMLPNLTQASGGTLLGYPNIARVQLYPNDEFLYKFKPCAVENMSVNFAPGNTPAFFRGSNAPVEVSIRLDLVEIEYWLQEHVTGDSTMGGMFDASYAAAADGDINRGSAISRGTFSGSRNGGA